MKQIANSIIGIWLFSIALTLSPFHSFANKVNYYYTLACFVVIFLSSISIVSNAPILGSSILKFKSIRLYLTFNSFVLLVLASLVGLLIYVSGEVSLGSNREIFDSQYSWFNYIFIFCVPSSILLSLSIHSSKVERLIGQLAWSMCVVVLLFSGNRQFAFFSIVFISFYHLGKSKQPQLLMRRIALIGTIVIFLSISFSVARLDYLPKDGSNIVAKYMSSLTGATCTSDTFSRSPFETGFQLLYAYLGMNHSGFAYSTDFYAERGGYPFLSVTSPLIYRRVQQVGLGKDLSLLEKDYESYISSIAGGSYSHFFSTMFGAVVIEGWWPAFIMFSASLVFVVKISSSRATKHTSSELDYLFFVLIATFLVFGIMQFPMTEPFFAMLFLELLFMLLLNNVAIPNTTNSFMPLPQNLWFEDGKK